MDTIKRLFWLMLMALALTSCVRDVVLDAQEDPLLAVYCVIKVDSVQELKLSYAKSAAMTEAPRVTGATAVLTDLTEGREAGRFVRVSDSLWKLDYSAIPTHSYRLEITVPGHGPVWAEQTMPAEPPVEVTQVADLTPQEIPWLGTIDKEHIFGEDPEAADITIQIMRQRGTFYSFTTAATIWVYADSQNRESGQFELSEELCTDYPYADDINLTGKVWKGYTIPEDWREISWSSGLPFTESYLQGVSFHRNFLRFPKAAEQIQCRFAIDGGTYTKFTTDYLYVLSHLYFAALSDDYDRYLLDAYQQYYAEQSDDLSSIYLRDNLHCNIHDGAGIFGAATVIPVGWEQVGALLWAYKPEGFPLPPFPIQ